MDPSMNPYAPGSGLKPPAMVGRDSQILAFDTLVARTGNRHASRGIVMSGLRGVGKTVLLTRFKALANHHGWLTVGLEAAAGDGAGEAQRSKFARQLLIAARRFNPPTAGEKIKKALGSIGSFSATVGVSGVSLGIATTPGRADSGQVDLDLEEMVEDVSVPLRAAGKGFAVVVDEMQDLDDELLAGLVAVQHRAGQEGWPFFVVAAGLPSLPARLSAARSYAERLFDYHVIGPLEPAAAAAALTTPAEQMGCLYTPEAIDLLVDGADGYPYFLQEYGKAIWDLASTKDFTLDDAQAALFVGREQLDQGFFPSRWTRATPAERLYMRAMADDGDAGSRSGEVARRLGKDQQSLGPVRAQLIAKGLIYAPEHGRVAFTVPGMADYIGRQHGE